MSDYPGLDNYAERKRLFEGYMASCLAAGMDLQTAYDNAGRTVELLCPKRTYKPIPSFGTLGETKPKGVDLSVASLIFAWIMIALILAFATYGFAQYVGFIR